MWNKIVTLFKLMRWLARTAKEIAKITTDAGIDAMGDTDRAWLVDRATYLEKQTNDPLLPDWIEKWLTKFGIGKKLARLLKRILRTPEAQSEIRKDMLTRMEKVCAIVSSSEYLNMPQQAELTAQLMTLRDSLKSV